MTGSSTPAIWPAGALAKFGAADEIEISTRRRDGSLRPFVPIWIVAIGDALYVRSYPGADGAPGTGPPSSTMPAPSVPPGREGQPTSP